MSRIGNRRGRTEQNRSGILSATLPGRRELLVLRVAWLLAPIVIGPGLRSALDTLGSAPRLILEVSLWVAWFVGMVACLTPHPLSLTVVRMLAPAVIGFVVIAGSRAGWGSTILAGLVYGALLATVALLPLVGDSMVNGSAYGAERRMALRTPAVAIVGPIPLAWSVAFAGLVTWALLVAAERYWVAGVAAVIGAGSIWAAGRLLHQLARRWIVFVPAGFVIHDPFQLVDPILMARAKITRVGPAEVADDTEPPPAPDGLDDPFGTSIERLDLSAGSLGLAVEVESVESVVFGVRENGRVHTKKSAKVVFSPTLPGALLSEARIRGIRIKGSSGVG